MNKTSLTKLFYQSKRYLKTNSSTILTVVSAVGVVVTVVTAVKATPKAIERLDNATDEKGEKLTALETIGIVGTTYAPSILFGVATIGCIFGANALNKQQQAAMASAYALVDQSFKDYRNKLIELHGEQADTEIREAIARDKYLADAPWISPPNGLEDITFHTGEKVLFYDEFSERYFESTIFDVQNAEYHLNRNFSLKGAVYLNEFYEFLGIPQTEYGEAVGWSCSYGYNWIDFEHCKMELPDGLECYRICSMFSPDSEFLEY